MPEFFDNKLSGHQRIKHKRLASDHACKTKTCNPMKLIAVLLVVCSLASINFDLHAQEKAKALDAQERLLANAYVGAIKLRDWDFIYDNSSPDFQTQVCLDLLMASELLDNKQLSSVVDKQVDNEKLAENLEQIRSSFSVAHKTRLFDPCVSDKKALFLNGLKALKEDQLPKALTFPDRLRSISKRVDGFIKIEFEFDRFGQMGFPDDKKSYEVKTGTYRLDVLLDASKEKWIAKIK